MGLLGYIGEKAVTGLAKNVGKEALRTGATVGLINLSSKLETKTTKARTKFELANVNHKILWIYNHSGDKSKGYALGDRYEENDVYSIRLKTFHSSRDVFFYKGTNEIYRFHIGAFKKIVIYRDKDEVGKLIGSGSSTEIKLNNSSITYKDDIVRVNGNKIAETQFGSIMAGYAVKYTDSDMLDYIALGVLGSHVYEFSKE